MRQTNMQKWRKVSLKVLMVEGYTEQLQQVERRHASATDLNCWKDFDLNYWKDFDCGTKLGIMSNRVVHLKIRESKMSM